jgi:DNA polymerase III epsilon subunit-like protein
LVFDTETSHFSGCVLDIGWIIADSNGAELASYSKLWRLPARERIHSQSYAQHRITTDLLRRDGVDPKLELAEFFALVARALHLGVRVVAHNASFDVARLNHTALKHQLKLTPLYSAQLLCTMHNATKHCNLRKRGGKSLKPPHNQELYVFLHKCEPAGPLHRALPDCRITLACYVMMVWQKAPQGSAGALTWRCDV